MNSWFNFLDSIPVYLRIIMSFGLSGIICFCSTPLVKAFAYKVGAIDVPKDNRRMHKKPIPRLGGLAMFTGFLISVLLFIPLESVIRGILFGVIIIVVLGIIDDVMALGAKLKFIVQIFAALVPVLFGVRIEHLPNFNPFSNDLYITFPNWISIPLTVLWIVGITNAVNLIDGLDGLAAGVSSIASFTLLIFTFLVPSSLDMSLLIAALAGCCIGFLPYNFNPAKMFMGDTGATFLGYILAIVSVQGLFKWYTIISFAVPFLVLGLPIFDTLYAMLRRILSGRSPMSADRGHLHHRLIDMGFSQKQAVAILYSISGLLGLSAVLLTNAGPYKVLFMILICVAVFFISVKFINILKSRKNSEDNSDVDQDTHEFEIIKDDEDKEDK